MRSNVDHCSDSSLKYLSNDSACQKDNSGVINIRYLNISFITIISLPSLQFQCRFRLERADLSLAEPVDCLAFCEILFPLSRPILLFVYIYLSGSNDVFISYFVLQFNTILSEFTPLYHRPCAG